MAHPVDLHVGERVRQRRWMMALTQTQLGEHVGIKFQQIQKYESGTNRISASRIWEIAAALQVPVSFFFEGLVGPTIDRREIQSGVLSDKEAQELVRTYYAIPKTQRRRLFDLARVLGDSV